MEKMENKDSFMMTHSLQASVENRHSRASACSLQNVIETDYLQHWNSQDPSADDNASTSQISTGGLLDSEANLSYGTFEEELDASSLEVLRDHLLKAVSQNFSIRGRQCRLLAPNNLLKKITADVLRMSQNEPLGINGCRLHVRLDFDGCDTELCDVRCEEDAQCMFEIILSLKEEDRNWLGLKELAVLLPTLVCCQLSSHRFTLVHVGQAYKLEKVKLYSLHSSN